jgi:hypothetical protein
MLTVEFTAPQKDIIKLNITHHRGNGAVKKFETNEGNFGKLEERDGFLEFSSGDLKAVINKGWYSVDFYYKGKFITKSNGRSQAYIVHA